MRGDFDVNNSCYPIGYLRSKNLFESGNPGPLYKLTDMRSLEPLIPQDLSLDDAAVLAGRINRSIGERVGGDIVALAQQYLAELRA